ncbi:hypothetical protein VTK26DRAFT_6610 [Humicola hyalothermophila]
MEDPAEEAPDDGRSSSNGDLPFKVIEIAPDGDILLDVTFDTSKETLKRARRAAKPRPGQKTQNPPPPAPKARVRLGYRVQLSVLKHNSKYFDNLLSDTRFAEARSIEAAFEQLSLQNVKPSEAEARHLPVVQIHEDDEATQSAGQESVFADLLMILHRKQSTAAKSVTMHYLAVLALLADRFDCTPIVSRYLSALKYKWPATQTRLSREDGHALSRAAEETLRQKILVSWLLDQPLKMHAATRELVMYGSRRWLVTGEEDEEEETYRAAWWDLPDGLERELQHRRDCILNTIASVPRHFLRLYTTSRTRQCQLGYDSSASCDSYQLGEMVKFLVSRGLLFLVDFFSLHSSIMYDNSTDTTTAAAVADVGHVLATLRQCPSYQIDKHHTNCGLRTRMLPALEHIQAMLSSNVVSVSRQAWARDRAAASWFAASTSSSASSWDRGRDGDVSGDAGEDGGGGDGKGWKEEKKKKVYRFTRAVATDQRLRYEGAMAVDRAARKLFTADEWDWTAEDQREADGLGARWMSGR